MSDSTRVHIVFGAYGGIGSALARRLAHSGVQLTVSGRDSDASEWQETLTANLTSAFALLRASVKPMMKQKKGAIALTSTAAASHGLPNHEAIAAAKGGIDALVRSAGATYGPAGVRVNAVTPGLVETPLTARISSNEKARSASEAMHTLGRLGTPDDVAAAMAWLLSDEAGWITGQTLGVDGGLGQVRSAWRARIAATRWVPSPSARASRPR